MDNNFSYLENESAYMIFQKESEQEEDTDQYDETEEDTDHTPLFQNNEDIDFYKI